MLVKSHKPIASKVFTSSVSNIENQTIDISSKFLDLVTKW